MQEILNYFKGDALAASSWNNKYRHENESIEDFFNRIVNEFVRLNNFPQDISEDKFRDLSEYGQSRLRAGKNYISNTFDNLLRDFKHVIPGGSALSGIGTKKPVSLSNCFVIDSPKDTVDSIFNSSRDMAQIYKRRGGVGQDLSHLRPLGAKVNNASKTSTGIPSWMELYSQTTNTIGQDGRRGALMLSIDVRHPDTPYFTSIKQDLTKVTGANVSVKLNKEFIEAAKNDEDYILRYPVDIQYLEVQPELFDYNELYEIESSVGQTGYIKKVKAKELWKQIIKCAWSTGEPGIFNWDMVMDYDPTSVYPELKAISTNPCGELPLGAYDSCRLIASNLYSLVKNPFSSRAYIDWSLAYEVFYETQILADIFVDLELEAVDRILKKINSKYNGDIENLDHVSDEFKLWWKIRETGKNGRRTGTGITGYADMLAAIGKNYGDEEITEKIFKLKLQAELDASIDLAILNGAFPLWDKNKEFKSITSDYRDIVEDNGKPLNSWYEFIYNTFLEQWDKMRKYGRRNAGISTVAPTGTISLLAKTTSGCEPVFLLFYIRNRKCNPGEIADFVDQNGVGFIEYYVLHEKLIDWYEVFRIENNLSEFDFNDISKSDLEQIVSMSPWFGNTSEDLTPSLRVKTQSIMQKYITSSISSTVNLPNHATPEDVEVIYNEAFEKGCKGITVYRDGSRSGILVKESNKVKSALQERPIELECKVLQFKNEDKKLWAAFVGILDGQPYEIFTGPRDIDVFPVPSWVETGKIIKVSEEGQPSRYDFQYTDSYGYTNTLGGLSRVFNKEYWNYARLVSALMREGMEADRLKEVLDKLEFDAKTLNNWKNGVIRAVKGFIPDGKSAGKGCPDCGHPLVYENGCEICKDCGYSKCL